MWVVKIVKVLDEWQEKVIDYVLSYFKIRSSPYALPVSGIHEIEISKTNGIKIFSTNIYNSEKLYQLDIKSRLDNIYIFQISYNINHHFYLEYSDKLIDALMESYKIGIKSPEDKYYSEILNIPSNFYRMWNKYNKKLNKLTRNAQTLSI